MKILNVDDNEGARYAKTRMLQHAGFTVLEAASGEEALCLTAGERPDLVLLDVKLPDIDGLEVCRRIKLDPATAPTIVVQISATFVEGVDRVRALEGGADAYLTEPVQPDEFLATVRAMVRLRRAEEELRRARDSLELRVRERTLELEQANAALQREMAERWRLEQDLQRQREALYRSERLATMGVLLANVAHELNNPLTVVQLQIDHLAEEARDRALQPRITELRQAAARCLQVVQNFLALARRSEPQRTPVHLNTVVTEALQLLAHVLEINNIVVHQHLADDMPLLDADPVQLHQVVLNLLINAQQAFPENSPSRQVTITTGYDAAHSRLVLEVADTGPGIPAGICEHIFEPFFTTKPPGIGTGLGLPLCRSIVESHGGSIRVSSQPGQGTSFRIELPIQPSGVPVQLTPTPAAAPPPPAEGAAILVVEDEAAVALALAAALRRDDHRVDTTANGRQALHRLQEQDYDLILCDMRMPELDGPGLFRAVATRQPHLLSRFIFLTGDTLSPESQAFLQRSGCLHLAKPFTAADSRRIVRQALQAQR
ncbi:MAG TPA: response regulator [Alphaproteobacteria bacterium]|nr:response regulator [Alphaproteobacteria bacterium]